MSIGDESESTRSRYVIGIDLGTTNCALSYIDTHDDEWRVQSLMIPQWVDVGVYDKRETLPSFHYEFTAEEQRGLSWQLPWERKSCTTCVGVYARDAAHRHPGRRIASAKSWLSHDGVDRASEFLPWHGDRDVQKLSPVDVSSRYLKHLRDAWDHQHPDEPMDCQDVVITLPASFDEVARQLTVLAAKKAGIHRIYLIEEPQAAFYAWIDSQGDSWESKVQAGQMFLVCDIGGGTTDFTLIRVRPAGDHSRDVQFHRVAVGDHLILGGDNLDLALAKYCEQKILAQDNRGPLSSEQWERLTQAARLAKDALLSPSAPQQYTINLSAGGSSLLAGALQVQITQHEIYKELIDGFFPLVDFDSKPTFGESGFREFGLPYASDPAVTRHLAAFLSQHRRTGLAENDQDAEDRPAAVLFNGGVLESPLIRDRLIQNVSHWFAEKGQSWQPQVLEAVRRDLAVAHGAAYYGMVRRGEGVRIAANLGRSYFFQVSEAPVRAMCLIPGNAQPGEVYNNRSQTLLMRIGQPVQFRLWSSSTRLADLPGQVIDLQAGELTPLPPVFTVINQIKRRDADWVQITLEAELTEIGTVEIYCVELETGRRWQLEFDIRSTLETDRQAELSLGDLDGILDDRVMDRCEDIIRNVFVNQSMLPNQLVANLQTAIERKREHWPSRLLRHLWATLIGVESGRMLSAQHETRWLNLVGYCLRPGYGVSIDDWRVGVTWKTVYGKTFHPGTQSKIESMILWRRIAGGMSAGQQLQLASPIISSLRDKNIRLQNQELIETWRLLGSLERLPIDWKLQLGQSALAELTRRKSEPLWPTLVWALGRLGARQLANGPINLVLASNDVVPWIQKLMEAQVSNNEKFIALSQLSRRTDDRFRDISMNLRESVLSYLRESQAPLDLIELIETGGALSREQQDMVFGESLPLGVQLLHS